MPNGTYVNVTVADGLKVYLDCKNRDMVFFNDKFQAMAMPFSPRLQDLLVQKVDETKARYIGPAKLIAQMPVGNSEQL